MHNAGTATFGVSTDTPCVRTEAHRPDIGRRILSLARAAAAMHMAQAAHGCAGGSIVRHDDRAGIQPGRTHLGAGGIG